MAETGTQYPSSSAMLDPTGRFQRSNSVLEESRIRVVYSAFDTETAVEVAWFEYWGIPPGALGAIEKNLEILKQFNHPAIIVYHQAWVDKRQKKIYLITEAMPTIGKEGSITTLRRYVNRGVKMKTAVHHNWLFQVLTGLQFLHSFETPFIHRDLRCSNIFIRANVGKLKIGGLELGLFLKACRPAEFDGTPGFMATDLANENFTEKSDIYSFGMCALEMITTKYPYLECTTSFQIFAKQLNRDMPEELAQIEDPTARDLIEKCLLPVDQRPDATELLKHPLFNPQSAVPVPMPLVKADSVDDVTAKPPDSLDTTPDSHSTNNNNIVNNNNNNNNISSSNIGNQIEHDVSHSVDQSPEKLSLQLSSLRLTQQQQQQLQQQQQHQQQLQQQLQQGAPFLVDSAPVSIKCFTSTNECLRYFYQDFTTVEQLRTMIAIDLSAREESISLEYLDHDGDYVLVTQRTRVYELQEYAKSLRCSVALHIKNS